MINEHRRKQLVELMHERGWDSILLYGHGWRKEHFRSLVNVNYSGPHAAALLSKSGEIRVTVTTPWDRELVSESVKDVVFDASFNRALSRCSAVAGLELMQQRFIDAIRANGSEPASATAELEELRRVKTANELVSICKAVDLADRGYAHFANVVKVGMKEYELVAEVEGFLKTNGAEDNFMLIASGGVEVVGMKPPTDRVIQHGDSVTTELTPQVNGYYAQICRTIVLGEPNEGQLKAFSIFSEAQQAAEDLIAPGVNVCDAAKAQNDVFRKFGYGDYTGSKYTRVRGHGLGLFPDETPHILEDVDYVIKEGMELWSEAGESDDPD